MIDRNDPPQDTEDRMRTEVVGLVQYLRRFHEEIAQVVAADGDRSRFENMADQVDAIVEATEQATHAILGQMESINSMTGELRAASDEAERNALCDRLTAETTAAIEACIFQDITGQRISKIIRSMKFVEARVSAMVMLWGEKKINELAKRITAENAADGESALLKGPALSKEASISQDEIDKLFD